MKTPLLTVVLMTLALNVYAAGETTPSRRIDTVNIPTVDGSIESKVGEPYTLVGRISGYTNGTGNQCYLAINATNTTYYKDQWHQANDMQLCDIAKIALITQEKVTVAAHVAGGAADTNVIDGIAYTLADVTWPPYHDKQKPQTP